MSLCSQTETRRVVLLTFGNRFASCTCQLSVHPAAAQADDRLLCAPLPAGLRVEATREPDSRSSLTGGRRNASRDRERNDARHLVGDGLAALLAGAP